MVFRNRTRHNSESAAKSGPASRKEERADTPTKKETGAIPKTPQHNNPRRTSISGTESTKVLVDSEWPPLEPMTGKPMSTKEEQAKRSHRDAPDPYATTAELELRGLRGRPDYRSADHTNKYEQSYSGQDYLPNFDEYARIGPLRDTQRSNNTEVEIRQVKTRLRMDQKEAVVRK